MEFGKTPYVRVCLYGTGDSRGFGFVSFTNAESAQKACEALNGFSMNGRKLVVVAAKHRPAGESSAPGVCRKLSSHLPQPAIPPCAGRAELTFAQLPLSPSSHRLVPEG